MSADTGPAIALRGVRKVFTTPPGELHTAVRGLDPTVGRCEFTAVVAPTDRGGSTTSTLVSGLEELTECEALVPDEPLDPREDTRGLVVFGARALNEPIARVGKGVALTAGPVTGKRVFGTGPARPHRAASVSPRTWPSRSAASSGRPSAKRSASSERGAADAA